MNEEQIEPIDAHKSLCWTCKYGICVRESEIERTVHPIPGEQKDIFDQPANSDEIDMIEHLIEHKRARTVCYWRPDTIQQLQPMIFGKVEQCNRYEKDNR